MKEIHPPDRARQDTTLGPAQGQSRRKAVAIPVAAIERQTVEWLVPERIPLGALTMLVGAQGLGKSLFTCLLAGRLSRGELPCGTGATLLLSAEDSAGFTVRPRLEAVEADLDRIAFAQIRYDGLEAGFELPKDASDLGRLATEVEARLIVIDPLSAHLADANTWRDGDVRRALSPLHRLAETSGAAILALLHLNKGESSDPLRRTGGSVAFTAAARSVLLLGKDPNDTQGESGSRRVLAHVKSNLGPLAGSLLYEIQSVSLDAGRDAPAVSTAALIEIGESSLSGHDLLACTELEAKGRGAFDEATDHLRAALAGGPRLVGDVKEEAASLGISGSTLGRAARRLDVRVKRQGFGGQYTWALPAAPASPHGEHVQRGEQAQTRTDTGEEDPRRPMLANPPLYGEPGEHGRLQPGEEKNEGREAA